MVALYEALNFLLTFTMVGSVCVTLKRCAYTHILVHERCLSNTAVTQDDDLSMSVTHGSLAVFEIDVP